MYLVWIFHVNWVDAPVHIYSLYTIYTIVYHIGYDFYLITVLTNSKISYKLLHGYSEFDDCLAYGVAQWT
jgi:hypothetical protein